MTARTTLGLDDWRGINRQGVGCLRYAPSCIIYVVSGLISSTFAAIPQSTPHLERLCLAFPKGQPITLSDG